MGTWPGERVVVTGATGFVGAALVTRLMALGHEVHAVQRRPASGACVSGACGAGPLVWQADLMQPDALPSVVRSLRPNVVFHAAVSRAEQDWRDLSGVNVVAPMALLEACKASGVRRLVTLGSALELCAVAPSAAAASRAAGALMMAHHARAWAQPLTHIRTSYVYGRGMAAEKFVPALIRAGLEGTAIRITPDAVTRNYVHVQDVVDACLVAAQAQDAEVRMATAFSPASHSASAVSAIVAQLLGRELTTVTDPQQIRSWDRAKQGNSLAGSQDLSGWAPRIALRTGIADMIEHLRGGHAA